MLITALTLLGVLSPAAFIFFFPAAVDRAFRRAGLTQRPGRRVRAAWRNLRVGITEGFTAIRYSMRILYLISRSAWDDELFSRAARSLSKRDRTWLTLLTQVRKRPVRVLLRLAPAFAAVRRAYTHPKEAKTQYTLAFTTLFSWVLDAVPGSDSETYEDLREAFVSRCDTLVRFFTERNNHQALDTAVVLKIVVFAISALSGSVACTESAFSWISNVLQKSTRNMEASGKLAKTFFDFFACDAETQEINQLLTSTQTLITDFRCASFSEKVARVKDIKGLLEQSQRLLARVDKNPDLRTGFAARSLARQTDLLIEIEVALRTAMDFRATIRPEPVCRNFVGLPGVGKSYFVNNVLFPRLAQACGYTGAPEENVYVCNPANKHFAGYTAQKFFYVDEFLANQMDDPIILNFNALATSQPTLMDGADLAFKNMRPQHEFLITVSNYTKLNRMAQQSHRNGMVDALNSRLNNVYVHLPEYDTNRTRTQQVTNRVVCVHDDFQADMPAAPNACPARARTPNMERREEAINRLVASMHEEWTAKMEDYRKRLEAFDRVQDETHHEASVGGVFVFSECTRQSHVEIARDAIRIGYPKYKLRTPEDSEFAAAMCNGRAPADTIIHGFANEELGDTGDCYRVINACIICDRTGFMEAMSSMGLHSSSYRFHGSTKMPNTFVLPSIEDAMPFLEKLNHFTDEDIGALRRCVRQMQRGSTTVVYPFVNYLLQGGNFEGVFFEDLGIVFRRGPQGWFCWYTPTGMAKMLIFGAKNGLQREVNEHLYSCPAGDDDGPNKSGKSSRAAQTANIVANLVVALAWAYLAYAVGSKAYNILKPYFGETTEDEPTQQAPEHQEAAAREYPEPAGAVDLLQKPGLLASLLAKFKVTPEGVEHEGGLVYDPSSGRWLHKQQISEERFNMLRRANREYGTARGTRAKSRRNAARGHVNDEEIVYIGKAHQSMDAGARPKKRAPVPDVHFESFAEEDVLAHMASSPHAKGDETDQALMDNLAQARMTDPTPLNIATRAALEAQVTVIGNHSRVEGCAITSNYVLTVAHIGGGKLTVVRKGRDYRATIIYRDTETDVMVLRIDDPTYPKAKNILTFFASAENLTTETVGGICLNGPKTNTVHYGHLVWDLAGLQGSCDKFSRNICRVSWPTRVPITRPGSCGSLMVLASRSRGSALFAGIHSFASSATNYAGVAIITRDLLEDILSDHESGPVLDIVEFEKDTFHSFPVETRMKGTFTQHRSGTTNPIAENDRIHYRGTYLGSFIGQATRTEFHPVPHPLNDPPHKVPAIPMENLAPEAIEKLPLDPCGRPSRGFVQLKKMEITEHAFSDDVRERLIRGLTQHYLDLTEPGEVRVLSNFEVVNGVAAGPLKEIKGLDMSTSPGYTLKKLFCIRKKGQLFEFDGVYKPRDTPATSYLYSYIQGLEDGEDVLSWPFTATLKDELLPASKVRNDGKVRLFSNCDMLQLFADKKYFGWCMGWAHNHLHQTHCTVGMRPMVDFDDLYRSLGTHPHLWTGDYSGWDKTVPKSVLNDSLEVILNVCATEFTESEYSVARALARNMLDRLEVFEGHLFHISGGMPSGIWLTNFLNSLANVTVRLGCIMQEFADRGREIPEVDEILQHVVFRDHGDDEINSVSEAYAPFVDYFTMKRQKQRLGLKVTPATKDGVEQRYEDVDETSFISRFPKEVGGRIIGALKKESIEQQLEYQRDLPDEERLHIIQGLLVEAYPHGREYYNKIRSCAVRNLKAWRISVTGLPSYETSGATLREEAGIVRVFAPDTRTMINESEISHPISDQTDQPKFEMASNKQENNKNTTTCWLGVTDGTTVKPLTKHYRSEFPVDTALETVLMEGDEKVTHPTEKQMRDVLLETEWDTSVHFADTAKHREAIDAVGNLFFGRAFPQHDLSKFSSHEALGYQLLFFEKVKGITWTYGLWHHYKVNAHHPAHGGLPTWDEYVRGTPIAWDRVKASDLDLQEVIADAVACIERHHKGTTPFERLKIIKESYEKRGPVVAQWPQALLTELLKTIKGIKNDAPAPNVPEYSAGGMKFPTFRKYLNFLVNSKQQKTCPDCESDLPAHRPSCAYYTRYQSPYDGYQNESAQAVMNYVRSRFPRETPYFVRTQVAHESGPHTATEKSAIPHQAQTTAAPITINRSGAISAPVIGVNPGLPPSVNAMTGYTTNVAELCYDFNLLNNFSIPSTASRGTVVASYGYGEIESMNQAARTLAQYHKYIQGPMEIELTLYGAANKTGSLLIGWVPDVAVEPTIEQLYAFNHCTSLTMTTQSTGSVPMVNAGDKMEPRRIGTRGDGNGPRPGVYILVEEPVENTLGDGATQIAIRTRSRLMESARFDYVLYNELGSPDTPLSVAVNSETSLAEICGQTGDMELFSDGTYVVSSRRHPETMSVTLPPNQYTMCTGRDPLNDTYIAKWHIAYSKDGDTVAGCLTGDVNPVVMNERAIMAYGGFKCDYNAKLGVPINNASNYRMLTAYWSFGGGSSRTSYSYKYAEALGTSAGYIERGFNDILPLTFINAFTDAGNLPGQRTTRGLKRFTLGTPKQKMTVNTAIETKFPVVGETFEEQALRYWVKQRIGNGNALLAIEVSGYPVGEVLWDDATQTFWIDANNNYAYLATTFDAVTVRRITAVGPATNPRRIPQVFTSLERAAVPVRDTDARHEAATGAMLMGMQGMATVGGITQTALSGGFGLINSGKNRRWASEQAAINRDFTSMIMDRQFGYDIASMQAGAEAIRVTNKLQTKNEVAAHKAKLAAANANMDSTRDPYAYTRQPTDRNFVRPGEVSSEAEPKTRGRVTAMHKNQLAATGGDKFDETKYINMLGVAPVRPGLGHPDNPHKAFTLLEGVKKSELGTNNEKEPDDSAACGHCIDCANGNGASCDYRSDEVERKPEKRDYTTAQPPNSYEKATDAERLAYADERDANEYMPAPNGEDPKPAMRFVKATGSTPAVGQPQNENETPAVAEAVNPLMEAVQPPQAVTVADKPQGESRA